MVNYSFCKNCGHKLNYPFAYEQNALICNVCLTNNTISDILNNFIINHKNYIVNTKQRNELLLHAAQLRINFDEKILYEQNVENYLTSTGY